LSIPTISHGKANREIRISARLWMNSRDDLAATAKEGAAWRAFCHGRSRPAGRWPSARLHAGCVPVAALLHLMFEPSTAGFVEDQGFAG
jgi:hypothetical protein